MILSAGAAAAAFASVALLAFGIAAARPDLIALASPILLTSVGRGDAAGAAAPAVGVRLSPSAARLARSAASRRWRRRARRPS